jgi:hypothetical protein
MKKIVVRALNATRTITDTGGLGSPSTDKTEAKEKVAVDIAERAANEARKSALRASNAAARAASAAR